MTDLKAPRIGATGSRAYPDGESWIRWEVFPPNASEDEIAESGFWRYYHGAGQTYGHPPNIRRTRTRTLVTQTEGWDV